MIMATKDEMIEKRRQLMSSTIEKLQERTSINNSLKSKKRPFPHDEIESLPVVSKKKDISKSVSIKPPVQEGTAKAGSFGIQTRIMRYMKERHLKGDRHPISIEEIMVEMNEKYHIDLVKHLQNEFFANNSKIEMENGRYKFKPRYDIKSRAELLELLKRRYEEGLGNVLLSDVLESYRKAEVAVRRLESENKLIRIVRKRDQNTILLYKETDDLFFDMGDCSSFVNVFHSINIESVAMSTIEDKLQVESVKSDGSDMKPPLKKPVVSRRKPRKTVIRTNASLANTLTY